MAKPWLFTVGARVTVTYRSTQETRNDDSKHATGFIIEEDNGVLVIEEYSNFVRENEYRHVLFDEETKNVYSQTATQTQRLGQAVELKLMAPPWESKHDTTAGGLGYLSHTRPELRMIQEGVYAYPDPDNLDNPDGWEHGDTAEEPVPERMREQNPDTVYTPPVDISAVTDSQ